jgi:hypothetical protein
MTSLRKPSEKRETYGAIYFRNNVSTFLRKESQSFDPLSIKSEYKAGCYEYKCSGRTLQVIIEGKVYNCMNESITVPGFEGQVKCPSAEVVCSDNYKCKFGCTDRFSNNQPFKNFYNK